MARSTGDRFEQLAADYLADHGYLIIERNWHAGRYGELDIVCLSADQQTLVFVEVKGRNRAHHYQDSHDQALSALTPVKCQRLCLAIEHYLATHPECSAQLVRFDLLTLNEQKQIRHYENIDLSH